MSFSQIHMVLVGGSLVVKSCPTLATPWTVAHQAPLPMGFPRQKYCGGLPFPSPRDPPDLGIEPRSPALQADSLLTEPLCHLWKWPRWILVAEEFPLKLSRELSIQGVSWGQERHLLSTPHPEALSPNENDQQQHLVWIFGPREASSGPHCS